MDVESLKFGSNTNCSIKLWTNTKTKSCHSPNQSGSALKNPYPANSSGEYNPRCLVCFPLILEFCIESFIVCHSMRVSKFFVSIIFLFLIIYTCMQTYICEWCRKVIIFIHLSSVILLFFKALLP